eukprot:TRINITY_DN57783_c0_g1_i1.p1 TRINITY_DN57783_c0_g1~~TRINITY_DN57783_c0_g1_i1.p1  ORF type:complete len:287 (-),score=52.76 TRINITY_DN57783_c0_g1_i1:22-807(-)
MQDARALLDSLMGPSRDKSFEEQQKNDGWKERNVCKRYLIGFCPNNCNDNMFHNTRRDTGMCTKVHSDRLKQDFEGHPDRTRYEPEYEKDFLIYLESQISEADAWIAREKGNCAGPGKVTKLTEGQKQTIGRMQREADDAMKEAEELAENGDVSASQRLVALSEKLLEDIQSRKDKSSYISTGEEVCEICGVRGNRDEVAHYQAHLNGNLHRAMTQIREKAQQLREKLRSGGDRERGRDHDRDRDRRRASRSRSRNRKRAR